MKYLSFLLINIVQTLLRVLPFPCKTGLVRIGNPGRDSPVLMTCNFRLTVERVKRALRGIDSYLLVVNSRGVNVWCAATGGLFTNHGVISVLKTSGIEKLVDHRQVILPQLSATGIEGKIIYEKTGWTVVWGPVQAAAISAFLKSGLTKTLEMRTVNFPWPQRIEMAVAWSFPISILLSILLFLLWKEGLIPLLSLVWTLSLVIFLSFPLYEKHIRRSAKRVGFVFFDFGQRGLPLLLWVLFMVFLFGLAVLSGHFSWSFIFRWGFATLVVVLILSIDLIGSTPVYKSNLHKDRLFSIELDKERCKGVSLCEQVCPLDVFEVDDHQHLAVLQRADRCVQCGACIVQCPFDALYFKSPKGEVVMPDVVRTFKLNLLGSRSVSPGASSKDHWLRP